MHIIQLQLDKELKKELNKKLKQEKELSKQYNKLMINSDIYPNLPIDNLNQFVHVPFEKYPQYFEMQEETFYNIHFDLKYMEGDNKDTTIQGVNFSFLPAKNKSFIEMEIKNFGKGTQFKLFKLRSDIALNNEDIDEEETMVSVLCIPTFFNLFQMCSFFDAYLNEQYINKMNLLIKYHKNKIQLMFNLSFLQFDMALNFYNHFNGQPYDKEELNYCFVLFTQFNLDIKQDINLESCFHYCEIPTCTQCLLRLDINVTGLRSIPKQLDELLLLKKEVDVSCKTCKYTKEYKVGNETCIQCKSKQDLWICMICQNIGCGRYHHAHAREHFEATNHSLALELNSSRVWDYISDSYQHRILQNDFHHQVIEDQQKHNAQHISELSDKLYRKAQVYQNNYSEVETQILNLKQEKLKLSKEYEATFKSNESKPLKKHNKKINKLEQQKTQLLEQINEQEVLIKNMVQNHIEVKIEISQLQKEYLDLQEQLKDLNFFITSKHKIENELNEANEGSLYLK